MVERVDLNTFKSGGNGGFINAYKATSIDVKNSNFIAGEST